MNKIERTDFLRRALQLLSSGLFLPGSNGLYDPFNNDNGNSSRTSINMSLEEQDRLCYTSQTLLRALAVHPRYVLGIENGPDIFAGPCQLNGIRFVPSEPIQFKSDSHDKTVNDNQQQIMVNDVNS
jgi:hypothetical protein